MIILKKVIDIILEETELEVEVTGDSDLFDDLDNNEKNNSSNSNNNVENKNNTTNKPKEDSVGSILDLDFDDDAPMLPQEQENDDDTYDLQKELEAKFDELFGPLEDDEWDKWDSPTLSHFFWCFLSKKIFSKICFVRLFFILN